MSNHIFNRARKDPTRNKSWRLFPRMKGVKTQHIKKIIDGKDEIQAKNQAHTRKQRAHRKKGLIFPN